MEFFYKFIGYIVATCFKNMCVPVNWLTVAKNKFTKRLFFVPAHVAIFRVFIDSTCRRNCGSHRPAYVAICWVHICQNV